MIKKTLCSLLITSTLLFLTACARYQPIHNVHNQIIPKNLTTTQVKRCIVLAGNKKGWEMKEVEPGLIHAMIYVRQHEAEIAITYSKNNYSIDYHSSQRLTHGSKIHRNYNKWIMLLNNAIQEQISFMISNS